jgi:hypothetical protein
MQTELHMTCTKDKLMLTIVRVLRALSVVDEFMDEFVDEFMDDLDCGKRAEPKAQKCRGT